jgi:cytohesin
MASTAFYTTSNNWEKPRRHFVFERTVEVEEEEVTEDFPESNQYNEISDMKSIQQGQREISLPSNIQLKNTSPRLFSPVQLCTASWERDLAHLQDILRHEEIDVDYQDSRSFSALHYSCSNGDSDITDALLERGSSTNLQDKNGSTPLLFAAAEGNLAVLVSLIEHGADPNIQNYNGETALHLAASNGHNEIVSFLLEHGAQVNARNLEGVTALHLAVSCGHEHVIQSLLAHGAHINARDDEGDTPLHWSVRAENARVLELLVKRGADVDLPNEDEETPLDLAHCLGEAKLCGFLSQYSKMVPKGNRPSLLGSMESESLAPDYFTFA